MRKKLFALFGVYVVTVLILTSCTNSRHNTVYLNKGEPYLTVLQQQNKKLVNQFYNENALLSHNADGTYDLTMFSSPVYIEEARTRNIIDNTIELMDNSPFKYTNHRNDVKTCLPEQLSENQGILLSYKTKKLTIYPQTAESKKAKKDNHTDLYGQKSERLRYAHTFDQNDYTVLINDFGVNTEIEIQKNVSALEYVLEIENVTADTSCPDYILFRHVKDKEAVAVIYKPVVKRKDESLAESLVKNTCEMYIVDEGQNRYRLTIALPKSKEKQAYPLILNQSFHMYKSKQPDSAVYSLSNAGYYLNDKVVLGQSEKGNSELNIRFEALDLVSIPPENILSATYTISEISGGTEPATIQMRPILSEWCSINTRWRNRPDKTLDYSQTVEVTQSGDYIFDVTEPLRLWMLNKGQETAYIIRHGFNLVNLTPQTPKVFATADNGTFTTCLTIHLKTWEEIK